MAPLRQPGLAWRTLMLLKSMHRGRYLCGQTLVLIGGIPHMVRMAPSAYTGHRIGFKTKACRSWRVVLRAASV